jgi:uncharacterized membrane protein
MSGSEIEIPRAAIEPIECFRESWRRIAGEYWLFLGITTVGLIGGALGPLGVLLGPMQCGIYLCYLGKWRGEPVRFETLFRGFDYFVESLIAALVLMGVGLVIVIPCVFAGFVGALMLIGLGAANRQPAYVSLAVVLGIVGYMLLILLASLIGSFLTFTFLLIVDRKLTAIEAVKRSAEAVWRNFGGMLALSLLGVASSLVGMCFCYVGALFVAPITFGAIVAAYQRIFGIEGAIAAAAGQTSV